MFLLPGEMMGSSHTWRTLVGSHRVLLDSVRVIRGHEVIGSYTELRREQREQIFIYITTCPPTNEAKCSSCASASSQDRLDFTLAKPIESVMKLKAGWLQLAECLVWRRQDFICRHFASGSQPDLVPERSETKAVRGHLSLWRSTLSPCKFVLRLLPADVCFAEQEWVTWGSFCIQQATSPFNSPFPNRRSCDKEERQIPGSLEMLFPSLAPWEEL